MSRSMAAGFVQISWRTAFSRLKGVDPLLCYMLGAVIAFALIVLYSAVDGDGPLFRAQLLRLLLGVLVLVVAALSVVQLARISGMVD